jgi:cytochrome c oxidase subunit 1
LIKPLAYSCNHSYIGMQYLISASIGGSLGTAVSQLIRLELSSPGYITVHNNYHEYNILITGHGLLMIFFMIMPALIGAAGNVIVPVQLAAADMV